MVRGRGPEERDDGQMKTALMGFGYWGMNVARTVIALGHSLEYVLDPDVNRMEKATATYRTKPALSLDEILDADVDAVFIATPPDTHFPLAKKTLLAGKHVFVEKPFATSIEDAYELLFIADRAERIAFVDHTFVHSEPVKYLRRLVDEKAFGDILYINSRRINLGIFQHQVDVIWDLAVHDLSIIDFLVGLNISRISVFKKKYSNFPRDAFANISCELQSGVTVNIAVSWLSPVKVREMIIGGTAMMAVFDDTAQNKIRLYDRGVILQEELGGEEIYKSMVQYKFGDVTEPEIPRNPALRNAIAAFIECIRVGALPRAHRESILRVTKVLEMISINS